MLSGFKYMSGNILDAVRDFLRNNTDGAGCNPRIQSYMTGMPSHDFHYAASFMRFAGIIQFIYTFNNRVHSRIKTNSVFCTGNIIINSSWNANTW